MAATTGAFGYNPSTNTELFIAMAPLQITGAQTVVVPIPDDCVAWQVQGVGTGGSGGVNGNSGAVGQKATGGGGGPWARIFRKYTKGSSSLTVILGAPGVATGSGNQARANGADGASSTVSDGTITLTLPGGKKGNSTTSETSCAGSTICASPTVSDGGNIDFSLGGTSGQVLGTATAATSAGCSGGAGPGSIYGAGGNSGAVGLSTSDASTLKASGGASCYASSGSVVTGSTAASGGAGKFSSANVTSGAGAAGGTLSSTTGIVYGQTAVGQQIIADWFSYEGIGDPGSGSTSALVTAGLSGCGSAAAAGLLVSGIQGQGGFRGGSGGVANSDTTPSPTTASGKGGAFAGSGGSICNVDGGVSSGAAGFGGGSGGAANGDGDSSSSGSGGHAAVQIIFYLRKP